MIQEIIGKYTYEDNRVIVTLDNANYTKNEEGELFLNAETAERIDSEIDRLHKEFLNSQLMANFISISEAIEILGITKQAFSKNKKINRGFIYFIEKDDKKLFLKESVELYKETKDGRFSIKEFCKQAVNTIGSVDVFECIDLSNENKYSFNELPYESSSMSTTYKESHFNVNISFEINDDSEIAA